MRIPRSFRPVVDPLEPRVVPSTAATAPTIGDAEVLGVGAAGTVPEEGNGAYTLSSWDALHGYFATESAASKPPIVFLGDSITYGWSAPDPASRGSAVFATDFGPKGALSYGIPGDLTSNVLWRIENGELSGAPKVVVLLIGINDVIHGASAQQVTSGIVDDVSAIHAASPGTQVLVLGLLPTGNAAMNVEVTAVDASLGQQNWGSSTTYANVGTILDGPGGVAAPGLLFDGLHPSAAGYQLLADGLVVPISALLTRADQAASTVSASVASTASVKATATAPAISTEVAPIYIDPSDPTAGVASTPTTPKSAPKPAQTSLVQAN